MMLSVKQAAARLNISPQSIYSLIESGRLVAHRFGMGRGAIRVSEADLADFISSCREKRADKPNQVRRPRLKHIRV